MKSFKLIFVILVIFFKTGNVLSEKNLFNVNNIEVEKKTSQKNEKLAEQAIKLGFLELINRILLKDDANQLRNLSYPQIKDLVSYYQVTSNKEGSNNEKIFFNIFFDKDKLHNLFFKTGISYSDLINDELYLLPVLKKENIYHIFSRNFFYDNWNKVSKNKLVEFILPLENIETIQKINLNKNNIFELDIRDIFIEYGGKNLALIFIDRSNAKEDKIFLKTIINGKLINKTLRLKNSNLSTKKYNEKIILETAGEIINLIKLQNLIDIRTPSFINIKFKLKKDNDLVELNKRMKKIDLIENIYVQEFNKEYILLKIKYLGKVKKMINQLKKNKIILQLQNDQWRIELI